MITSRFPISHTTAKLSAGRNTRKDGEAVFTSEYTGITTPGESTVNTDENRVKVYDDLKTLDLTSDAALPKDISISYKGIDHVFTGNELIDDVRAEWWIPLTMNTILLFATEKQARLWIISSSSTSGSTAIIPSIR